MATSLPIICSNLGPMREIMGDHDYYFNPYNYSELLETIQKMILSFEVSNGNNNLIKNRSLSFTWENCRKETFNFISKSISN
jgi:glycosyltransferase involved in cell wall biosynthesis